MDPFTVAVLVTSGGPIVVVLIAAAVALNDNAWRREAVAEGKAEYYVNIHGCVDWRWKK